MSMSKKDYQAVAGAIYDGSPGFLKPDEHIERDGAIPTTEGWRTWARMRDAIADVFAADNSSFDRDRFVRATETGRDKGMRKVG